MINCNCLDTYFLHSLFIGGFLLKMRYDKIKIGNRLKEERKKAGFKSQDALVEYIQLNNYRSFKRQTISKWEKGEEMPPLDVLCTLCEPFNCELGYLLCEHDCKTKSSTDIHQITGLSEKSIEILKQWNKVGSLKGQDYSWARNCTRAINDLLEEDIWFSHEVLLPIADYCVKRHRYEEPALSDHERTKALKDFRLALFTASEGLISCIKAIYTKEK